MPGASGAVRGVLVGLTAVVVVAVPAVAEGLSPAAQRGRTLTSMHCASCHAIDKVSESPLKIAPPFRALHIKYPIENLRRPLREGVLTGHPTMPVFRLDPGQVEDIIAFLKTLED
jgi:mono/diheme cytochrome c family protein